MIALCDVKFRTIELPGHSPGQQCLYQPDARIILAGDSVLLQGTPAMIFYSKAQDTVADQLESFDKLSDVAVNLCLSGHGPAMSGLEFRKRVERHRQHVSNRVCAVLAALHDHPEGLTLAQTASAIPWQGKTGGFDQMDERRRYFALAEVYVILKHFIAIGEVHRTVGTEGSVPVFAETRKEKS